MSLQLFQSLGHYHAASADGYQSVGNIMQLQLIEIKM